MKTPRFRQATLLAVTVVLALALSGCVRFVSDLEVSEANTVSGEYIVAVETGTGENLGLTDQEVAEELWGDTGLGAALTTETSTPYSQDGYTGVRITFTDEPLAAFAPTSQHWGIKRDGDEFVVSGEVSGGSLTGDTDAAEGDDTATTEPDPSPTVGMDDASPPDVRVTLAFPGPVTSANGAISGRTVSWVITEDDTELKARAGAIAPPDRARTLAFLVTGVLIVAAIAYWLAGVIGRNKRPDIPRTNRRG